MSYESRPDPLLSREEVTELRKRLLTGALVLLQLATFWVSMDSAEISVFCTIAVSTQWAWIAYIHLLFAALLLLGLASIFFARLRIGYVVLLAAGLAVLPLQAHLVERGDLRCDVP